MRLAAPVLSRLPRVSRRGPIVLAGAAVLVLSTAGVAVAAPPGPPSAPVAVTGPTAQSQTAESQTDAPRAATPGGPHCTLAAGADQKPLCFATFTAAIAFATGGRVPDAPASAADAAHDPRFDAAVDAAATRSAGTAAATNVVGIEWADLNWTGATTTFYAGGSCDNSSDVDFRFASMPSGWNDRISSFKSYSNCAQQLFRGTNFSGGSLTIVIRNLSYVGSAANDQASSVTFN